jgi:hypothetical protein
MVCGITIFGRQLRCGNRNPTLTSEDRADLAIRQGDVRQITLIRCLDQWATPARTARGRRRRPSAPKPR